MNIVCHLALAIECWKCLSLKDKYCGDPFDTDKLVQENGPQQLMQCQTKCMKVKAHGKFIELRKCHVRLFIESKLVKNKTRNFTQCRDKTEFML